MTALAEAQKYLARQPYLVLVNRVKGNGRGGEKATQWLEPSRAAVPACNHQPQFQSIGDRFGETQTQAAGQLTNRLLRFRILYAQHGLR